MQQKTYYTTIVQNNARFVNSKKYEESKIQQADCLIRISLEKLIIKRYMLVFKQYASTLAILFRFKHTVDHFRHTTLIIALRLIATDAFDYLCSICHCDAVISVFEHA